MSVAPSKNVDNATGINPSRNSRRKTKQKMAEDKLANENPENETESPYESNEEDMEEKSSKNEKKKGKKGNKENKEEKNPLLEEMRAIMIETLNKSLKEFQSEITLQIDALAKSSKGDIAQLRGEVNDKIDHLQEELASYKSSLEEKLPKLDDRITLVEGKQSTQQVRIKELSEKNQALDMALEFQSGSLKEYETKIEALKTKTEEQGAQIEKLICENKLLQGNVNLLLEGHNTLDNKQRKYNLVFEGIAETKGEDVRQLINDLVTTASDDQGIIKEIDATYRIGRKAVGKPRPIITVFKNMETRDLVLSKASAIKRQANNTKLWINKDLTDTTRQRSTTVRKCFNRLKDQKVKCQMQGSAIKMNGKNYGFDNLDSLPIGARPSDCQTMAYDENSMCFAGPKAIYSNFYPAPLRYKSRYFTSSEQAFQWRKANHHKDTNAEKKILETADPFQIKKAGASVETEAQWKFDEESILHEIVREKFLQNKDIYRKFTSEQYTNYYECTTDTYWGCGCKIDAIDIDPETIKGKNRFGIILADLKREFTAKK